MSLSDDFLSGISEFGNENCSDVLQKGESITQNLVSWIYYIRNNELTGTADCLITGVESAIRESIACASIGIIRPAIVSLRLQIDLSLCWLYFKDHAIEWEKLQRTGDGFKMKGDLLEYIGKYFQEFGSKHTMLKQSKMRRVEDPFRLLSAHIHGQCEAVIPQLFEPKDIIRPKSEVEDFLSLQNDCTEYISDIFMSVYYVKWAAIPDSIIQSIRTRLTPKQAAIFFQ